MARRVIKWRQWVEKTNAFHMKSCGVLTLLLQFWFPQFFRRDRWKAISSSSSAALLSGWNLRSRLNLVSSCLETHAATELGDYYMCLGTVLSHDSCDSRGTVVVVRCRAKKKKRKCRCCWRRRKENGDVALYISRSSRHFSGKSIASCPSRRQSVGAWRRPPGGLCIAQA